MLIPNQVIKTTWMPANKEHYISKGYDYQGIRKPLLVNAEDLPSGSHMNVAVQCDYCGQEFMKQFCNYVREHQDQSGKDCCRRCWNKKFKENFVASHGVENPFELEDVKEKIVATLQHRYGVSSPAQSDEVKDRIAATNLEKYGARCSLNNPIVRAKAHKTLMDNYGVDNVFKSKQMQEQIKATQIAKYGEGNIAQTPEISAKIMETNIARYGVPYTTQVPDVIAKMRMALYQNGSVPTSKPEAEMCNILHKLFGAHNCQDGYPVDRINLDCLVSVGGVQIDFEYDGQYWHKDRDEQDMRRNFFLIRRGYKVVRIKANKFDTLPTEKQIIDAVDYLVKGNHSLTYIDMNI